MDLVEFFLQLLSVVFTVLGVVVAIDSIDRRWSLAAVMYRKLCSKDIDWEAERRKWQDAYSVDIERHACEMMQRPQAWPSLCRSSTTSRSDARQAIGHCKEIKDFVSIDGIQAVQNKNLPASAAAACIEIPDGGPSPARNSPSHPSPPIKTKHVHLAKRALQHRTTIRAFAKGKKPHSIVVKKRFPETDTI